MITKHDVKVTVSIVEFDSKPTIIAYFHAKVYEHIQQYVSSIIPEKKSQPKGKPGKTKNESPGIDIQSMTVAEMEALVDQRASKSSSKASKSSSAPSSRCARWEDIPPKTKYGVFYKKTVIGGKPKFIVLSEMIDMREMQKYNDFLFS
jgi:hypothetical protein